MAFSHLHEILVIEGPCKLRQLLYPFGYLFFDEVAETFVLQKLFFEDADGNTVVQRWT